MTVTSASAATSYAAVAKTKAAAALRQGREILYPANDDTPKAGRAAPVDKVDLSADARALLKADSEKAHAEVKDRQVRKKEARSTEADAAEQQSEKAAAREATRAANKERADNQDRVDIEA